MSSSELTLITQPIGFDYVVIKKAYTVNGLKTVPQSLSVCFFGYIWEFETNTNLDVLTLYMVDIEVTFLERIKENIYINFYLNYFLTLKMMETYVVSTNN